MASQNGKNFVESILDAQKSMVDNMVAHTKKATNGNNFISEAIDKGAETYNSWIEKQKDALESVSHKAEEVAETAKEQMNKATAFNQNWLNTQINWAKQAWEMNQNFIKNNTPGTDSFKGFQPFDWMGNMNNAWNQMTGWMNQATQHNQAQQYAQNWMNMMQQFNPANASDQFKKAGEQFSGMFNQYNELLQNTFAQFQKGMQNATTQDVYSNLVNVASGFGKFNEMWAPFWKSIQDNTFNAEQFKNTFNIAAYKEMLDKFFGFMPENGRQYVQQATEWMNNGMKTWMDNAKMGYTSGREFMNNMNPFAGQPVFGSILDAYQQMQQSFQHSVAPIAKLVTPNQFTKATAEWSEIADRMALYNIKNAEMQYMVYQQGQKVMDQLVANIAEKVQSGTEINSIAALYQEWLNLSDKVYVELFESDAYSKLMAEVSALQLKLRKDMDLQAEKMLANIPVATRSELDELYKVIYDLKKEVRQLEKMLELEDGATATDTAKAARKATTKK
jgi:hypothetical protein